MYFRWKLRMTTNVSLRFIQPDLWIYIPKILMLLEFSIKFYFYYFFSPRDSTGRLFDYINIFNQASKLVRRNASTIFSRWFRREYRYLQFLNIVLIFFFIHYVVGVPRYEGLGSKHLKVEELGETEDGIYLDVSTVQSKIEV